MPHKGILDLVSASPLKPHRRPKQARPAWHRVPFIAFHPLKLSLAARGTENILIALDTAGSNQSFPRCTILNESHIELLFLEKYNDQNPE